MAVRKHLRRKETERLARERYTPSKDVSVTHFLLTDYSAMSSSVD
jgi:hypothetical protein